MNVSELPRIHAPPADLRHMRGGFEGLAVDHAVSGVAIGSPDTARSPLLAAGLATLALLLGLLIPPVKVFSAAAYLPLHSALELLTICVCALVVGSGWNLRGLSFNARTSLLGAVFLAVAIVDFAHTFSYKGMPDFVTPSDPEKAIAFWLADASLVAGGLLAAAWMPQHPWSRPVHATAYLVALAVSAAVLWVGLFHSDRLPRTFVDGRGLTAFKIGFEYVIVAVHAAAAVMLATRARRESSLDLMWLAAAAWTLGAAEFFFTVYLDVSDISNALGHGLRAAGYLMIYRAVFVAGVRAPYLALAGERALLRTLIDATPDLVFFKSAASTYLAFNNAFAAFCGRSEARAHGMTDYDFAPRDLAEIYRQSDREVLRTGETYRHEIWTAYADGRRVCLDTLKAPLRGADGSVIGVVGISRDITDRKRLESELQSHRERLEEVVDLRTQQLLQAKDAAEAASRAKNRFLANISHEIRTPLNAITGMAQLIALDPRTRELHAERIRVMNQASEQLLGLIDNVLVLSRIESGTSSLESTPFDVVELIDGVRAMMTPKALAKGIEFSARFEAGDPAHAATGVGTRFVGDPLRLRQVLLNFVGNALKFTERGSIHIAARVDQVDGDRARLRFAVEDTGIGVDADHQQRIFEAFEQVDASTGRRYGGTGLGLAICAGIVRLMGGEIGVESQAAAGSTFWFTAWVATAPERAGERHAGATT